MGFFPNIFEVALLFLSLKLGNKFQGTSESAIN